MGVLCGYYIAFRKFFIVKFVMRFFLSQVSEILWLLCILSISLMCPMKHICNVSIYEIYIHIKMLLHKIYRRFFVICLEILVFF